MFGMTKRKHVRIIFLAFPIPPEILLHDMSDRWFHVLRIHRDLIADPSNVPSISEESSLSIQEARRSAALLLPPLAAMMLVSMEEGVVVVDQDLM